MRQTRSSPTFAKQNKFAARFEAQFAAISAIAATVCFVKWGVSTGFKTWSGLTVVFLASAALSRRGSRQKGSSEPKTTASFQQNGEFELINCEDNQYWERRILIGDKSVRIVAWPAVLERVRVVAGDLIREMPDVLARFQEFKKIEGTKQTAFADEIDNLEIESFKFGGGEPCVVEVRFTDEAWLAVWDHDRKEFAKLAIDG